MSKPKCDHAPLSAGLNIRVLVSGGGGFVGKHCMAILERCGIACLAIGRKQSLASAHYVQCDVHDRHAIERLMKTYRPTHLLHTAWTAGAGYAHDEANHAWVLATQRLIQTFVRQGGERVVGLGTCIEYHATNQPRHEVTTPAVPETLYGQAKLATAEYLADTAQATGLSYAWCRLFYITGPGEALRRLLPSACLAFLRGEDFASAALEHRFDYLDVRDVARAVVQVMLSDCQGVINIASGTAPLVRDVLHELATTVGCCARPLPAAVLEPARSIVGHVGRLRDELGFTPAYALSDSLRALTLDIKERICTP